VKDTGPERANAPGYVIPVYYTLRYNASLGELSKWLRTMSVSAMCR